MPNISKIKISGTSFNIKDENAASVVELTQAQYDALVSAGTVDTNTFYVITDAEAGDLSNYFTSAQTEAAITAAVSGKVDTSAVTTSVTSASTDSELPTAKAVYNAVGQGGGGGATYSAGTNISIDTANTISCTLPISWGNNYKISIGSNNDNRSYDYSFLFGKYLNNYNTYTFIFVERNECQGAHSSSFGYNLTSLNQNEASFGTFNTPHRANYNWGDSGNTLFSVGNGTSTVARHNAFEIRQNGDIYISSGSTDIKLQDHLGSAASSAITSGDTNAVQGGAVYDKFDEVEQVTARALVDLAARIAEIEEVTARALNQINDRLTALET